VVTRGLERVAGTEIRERVPGVDEPLISYRRVAFTTAAEPASLVNLRTVDDLFVDLGRWSGIGRQRTALARLGNLAQELDLRDAAALCGRVRELGTPPTFSVTANFVGRRNYSTDEIKQAIMPSIEASHRWDYRERDVEADLNLRIFIEHDLAYVGVRLSQLPLHERAYKTVSLPGSLKPTVAAAMVRLGEFAAGATIVDPFCGAGTIPIEAALMRLAAAGGDLAAEPLRAARRNAAAAGVEVALDEWDARRLPFDDGQVDGVVSNVPWGRQVAVDQTLAALYDAALREMARITRDGGRLILLTNMQSLVRSIAQAIGLETESEIEISLSGQRPMLAVFHKA
jgi:23S rRNA G2445 N2-methylase RlmL